MTYKDAVNSIEDLRVSLSPGLQAMGGYSQYVKIQDTREINGSVDIDKSYECLYPNDNRWDYSLGYRNRAFFVEVHPAYTGEVETVLKKLGWLKKWLSEDGKPLCEIKSDLKPFIWIYTGKFDILKNTAQYRAAVQNGIMPVRELYLK